MRHKVIALFLGLCMVVTSVAQAGGGAKEVLSVIPGDIMGVVFIPSPKQLDADYQSVVNKLGLQMFAPPSLINIVKMQLPALQGMDDSGVLAVVILQAENYTELESKQVLMVPTTDAKGMIETLGGESAEGGVWTVNLMGQPAFAVPKGKHLLVARSSEALKAVADSKTSLASKMKPSDLKAMENVDVGIWVDGEKVMTMLKPLIDGFLPMLTMGSPPAAAEMNKKYGEMLVNGLKSLSIGILLDDGGLGLRLTMTSREGTDLAKQMKIKTTTDSLLTGLPGGKYLLAFGQTISPEQLDESVKQIDSLFAMAGEEESLNQEKMTELKNLVVEWAPTMSAGRMLIQTLAPGPDGLFGVSLVIKTSDSKKWMSTVGKMVEVGKQILSELVSGEDADEEMQDFVRMIGYRSGAEKIAGASVDHIKLDLSKSEEIDEEDLEMVYKIIGKDGVLFRVAAADAKTAVISFGGGKDQMNRLVDQAKSNDAPLDNDVGVKKVDSHLPKARYFAMYMAADQIVAAINNVMTVLDEERLPFQVPEINAPLALCATGGDGWVQGDLFFPSDLLVAMKDVGFAMLGNAMAAPPPAEPAQAEPQGGEK